MSKVLREQHWWVYIEIMVYVVFIVHYSAYVSIIRMDILYVI